MDIIWESIFTWMYGIASYTFGWYMRKRLKESKDKSNAERP